MRIEIQAKSIPALKEIRDLKTAAALGARLVELEVPDALGRPIMAAFALASDGLAVIEMARASGLEQIAPGDRDVWRSSTRAVMFAPCTKTSRKFFDRRF